jgi:hypothetical protein
MVAKWEYKVEPFDPKQGASYTTGELEEKLNKLGKQGWELASLIRDETDVPGDHKVSTFTFFLKRPL